MSFFGSLLELNNSMAQTRIPPQCQNTWNTNTIHDEKHTDTAHEDASWIKAAKDEPYQTNSDDSQLSSSYASKAFSARYGEESNPSKAFSRTIAEGQATDSLCPCCQLPRADVCMSTSQCMSRLESLPRESCCCPDIKMPKEDEGLPPCTKPRVRRRSSLAVEKLSKEEELAVKREQKDRDSRAQMSVGAWL